MLYIYYLMFLFLLETCRVREFNGNECVLADEEYEQNWRQSIKSMGKA